MTNGGWISVQQKWSLIVFYRVAIWSEWNQKAIIGFGFEDPYNVVFSSASIGWTIRLIKMIYHATVVTYLELVSVYTWDTNIHISLVATL